MLKKLKEYFNDLSFSNKVQFIIAAVLTSALLISLPVYAWFTSRRSLLTATEIKRPDVIVLKGANAKSIRTLDLSEIDVTKKSEDDTVLFRDYVFGVDHGKDITKYALQLAHTTNIPFKYTIYSADEVTAAEKSSYISENFGANTDSLIEYAYNSRNELFYFADSSQPLAGAYKNPKEGTEPPKAVTERSDEYYKRCYGTYDDVQEYAVPLYWVSGYINTKIRENPWIDYYVLRVSWTPNNALNNDGETDIVYITVKSFEEKNNQAGGE